MWHVVASSVPITLMFSTTTLQTNMLTSIDLFSQTSRMTKTPHATYCDKFQA